MFHNENIHTNTIPNTTLLARNENWWTGMHLGLKTELFQLEKQQTWSKISNAFSFQASIHTYSVYTKTLLGNL